VLDHLLAGLHLCHCAGHILGGSCNHGLCTRAASTGQGRLVLVSRLFLVSTLPCNLHIAHRQETVSMACQRQIMEPCRQVVGLAWAVAGPDVSVRVVPPKPLKCATSAVRCSPAAELSLLLLSSDSLCYKTPAPSGCAPSRTVSSLTIWYELERVLQLRSQVLQPQHQSRHDRNGQQGPPGSLGAVGGAVRDDTKGEQQQPDEGPTGAEEGHTCSQYRTATHSWGDVTDT
jgi:hypothetical protein